LSQGRVPVAFDLPGFRIREEACAFLRADLR
jgi:hypothetical protein